jgi:hypothetical protein
MRKTPQIIRKKGNVMQTLTLSFQFDQDSDAKLALDSLQELGYHPSSFSISHNTVELHLVPESSTPSLEIMLAHGGELLVDEHSPNAEDIFSQAYQLDSYSEEEKTSTDVDATDSPYEQDFALFDPHVALRYDHLDVPEEHSKQCFD